MSCVLDLLLDAIHRLAQAARVHRFEQVIDRVHLKCLDGMLVVRGDKCDERHQLLLEHPHDPHPVQLRHLPIEQREVGPLVFDHGHRLRARRGFPDDHDIGERSEEGDEKGAGGPLVVGDHHAEAGAHRATRHASASARAVVPTGSRSSTVVPSPIAV